MELKEKLDTLKHNAGKSAKNFLDNAIHIADQNDDGKFDMSDVSAIAENVGDAVKKGTNSLKETTSEKAKQLEKKALRPIFPDDLNGAQFLIPKFIRVTTRDKKRAESEVCQGSIGYLSTQKGLEIVNIFRDSTSAFGLNFFPTVDSEFYYVDPSDRDSYIELDDYFGYLKSARVSELQTIAQDLGAKYFKVTYREEQTSFTEKKSASKASAKLAGSASTEHNSSEKKYSTVQIAAESEFTPHEPIMPQLKYWQRDPNINSLVSMRMNESGVLKHQKYVFQLSQSSGMKVSDAVKIDAVLRGMKLSGNCTVASEAQNETRRYLEYEIDF